MNRSDFRISLLGEVRAWHGSREIPLGSPSIRLLLTILALARGWRVDVHDIADAMWDAPAPSSAVTMIRCYVHRLRSEFPIETIGPGYALSVDNISTDLDEFRDLVASGARSLRHQQPEIALEYLDDAILLWRGNPLSGLGENRFVIHERQRLDDYRVAALELSAEARIAVRDYQSAIEEAEFVIKDNPFRERMLEFLMIALHRTGRSKEAIVTYFSLERRLIDEFGVNPCPRLRAVFDSISAASSAQLNL